MTRTAHDSESSADGEFPTAAWMAPFRRRLLAWFRRNARDLPWRRTRDPYAVWISEIMLQQTQVATVIGYFERFLTALPTIADLAAADEQQVLRLWEGLGYYRRARQLHAAARVIVAEHGGCFPRDIQQIRALPGIGRYTAGAIASISWDAREPILEANTIRVFSRLLAYRGDPQKTAGQRRLWEFARCVLPAKDSGALNQALMELGSEICTPRGPLCERCPVRGLCPTFRRGLQDQIPLPKRKTAYEDRHEAAVIVRRGDRVVLRRCGPDERWAGLWDFPRFHVSLGQGETLEQRLQDSVQDLTGLRIQLGRKRATLKHGVTRFRITLDCYEAECVAGRLRGGPDARWVKIAELEQFPLSVTGRQLSRLVPAQRGELSTLISGPPEERMVIR